MLVETSVQDVERSIIFYQHFGFTVTSIYKYRECPVWAALQSEGAELMVTRDGDPSDPAGQGILFYLYSRTSPLCAPNCLPAALRPGRSRTAPQARGRR